MTGEEIETAAHAFVAARAVDRVLADYPCRLPATLADGYAVQERAITLRDGAIGGWKVGRVPPALMAEYGDDRLAGPVWSDSIRERNGDFTAMPVLSGFAAVEAELMIRLDADNDRPLSLAEVRECAVEVRLGIEVASSPFTGINDHGPAITVSDFGNNYGLLIGPAVSGWRALDLATVPVSTAIDDRIVGTGTLAAMLDGAFGAVAWLTRHLAARGRALGGGWVSSGAITGVHQTIAGHRATVRFGDHATLGCETVAAEGTAAIRRD